MKLRRFLALSSTCVFLLSSRLHGEIVNLELPEAHSELFIQISGHAKGKFEDGRVILRSLEAAPRTAQALGCLNLRTAEAALYIYNVWRDFKGKDLKKILIGVEGAKGLYALPSDMPQKDYAPPGYRLTHILYGRDIGYKEADSDLFMGIYEPLDRISSLIVAFKGTTPGTSDWINNIFNRGAEHLRDFFGVALGDVKDDLGNPSKGYMRFFADYFAAHHGQIVSFTGHSLGGALSESMARFFSVMLERAGQVPPRMNVIVYNPMGAGGMLAKLGSSMINIFKPHGFFDNIAHQEFVTKGDPLQKLNRLLRLSRFTDSVVMPTERMIQSDGSYKSLGLISEHNMENVLQDLNLGLRNDGLDYLESVKRRGFRGDDDELEAAIQAEKTIITVPDAKGVKRMEKISRKGHLLWHFSKARRIIEGQKKIFTQAKPYLGDQCQM